MKLQNTYTKTIGAKDKSKATRLIVCRGIVREVPVSPDVPECNPHISPFIYNLMVNKD